ncbi:patatin-like phospholipase family protein [Phenylobacterium sp.]|uniref:patatin-like phospholipase family protein n=1 Tax=Phenylobacterium sp. TaxID=1871053 RepID=UPI002ED8E76B
MKPARSVCLALQGGGALGAFTWGLLDACLRDGLRFEGISGASAGAVNAVVLADALTEGDADHAREKLSRVWRKVSNAFPLSGTLAVPAALAALDLLPIPLSPTRLNPFGLNPLRDVLEQEIDFARLRRESPVQLFISATRVDDGRARIFHTGEITLEAVLASACLPQLQQAVEIDGAAYWDGGYSANPPIMELVRATRSPDLLVVELTTPLPSNGESRAKLIEKRLRDFALSAPLQRELDTLEDLQRMCRADRAARSRLAHRLRALRLHRISAQAHLAAAIGSNALDLNWTELMRLAESGGRIGEHWMRNDLAFVPPAASP